MRLTTRLAAATALAAGLLAIAPVMAASAASAPHTERAAAQANQREVTVPLRLTSGQHTISKQIRLSPAARPEAVTAVADTQKGVSVRVGKNNCGGFNGNVSWGFGDINIWGTLWDNCDAYTANTTVYLYLKFTVLGTTYNDPVQSVSGGSTGVNAGSDSLAASPGGIYVDTCLKWNNGWGCGPSQHL